MELWIRVQCRYRLIKVDDIIVRDNDLWYESEKGSLLLGNYKDEKRALEILDEIQATIKKMEFVKLTLGLIPPKEYDQEKINIMLSNFVYEMPKE